MYRKIDFDEFVEEIELVKPQAFTDEGYVGLYLHLLEVEEKNNYPFIVDAREICEDYKEFSWEYLIMTNSELTVKEIKKYLHWDYQIVIEIGGTTGSVIVY